MIALLGTTGKIGGTATQVLQQQQIPIRPVTRDMADMRDPDALTQALQGTSSALIILPFDPKSFVDLEVLQRSILQSLSRARPEQFLFISDYGAHNPKAIGIPAIFHHFEKQLLNLQIPCTILRSAEHMQNWLRNGRVSFYPPDTPPRPFVSAHDVGQIAARLLLEPPTTRVLHAEGPRRYDIQEIPGLQTVPPGARLATLRRAGLPTPLAELLDATYQAHGQGLIEVEPGGQVLRGATPLQKVFAPAG